MNEEECNKVINFLYFLKECSGRLNEIKGVSEKEYLLEEYFISNATHEELQAYYVLVKNNFSLSTLKERIKLSSEDFTKLIVSLTKKGICTTYWNLEEMSEDVKEALTLREELSEKLLSYSPKEKRKIIII